MGGVGTDVATLVIGVDREIQPHKFKEFFVLGEAELVREVETVILILLHRRDLTVLVNVTIDTSSDGGELGDEIHRILEGMAPVFGLRHALGVSFCEGRFVLQSRYSKRELSHWVQVIRAAVKELLDEARNRRAGSQVGRKIADLLFTWNLAGQ